MRNAVRLSVYRLPASSPCHSPPRFLPTPHVSARRFRSRCFLSRLHCTRFFAFSLSLSLASRSRSRSLSFFRSGPLPLTRSHWQHTFASDQVLAFLTIVGRAERLTAALGARAFVRIRANNVGKRAPNAGKPCSLPSRSHSVNQRRADLRNGGREKGHLPDSRRMWRTNSEEKRPRRGSLRRPWRG